MNALHESIQLLERLAALCATEGVDDVTKKIANEHMQKLLNACVKIGVQELTAKSSGITIH